MLDTNVLYSGAVRDLLLSFAAERLFRPLVSDAILEELENCELRKLLRVCDRVEAVARSQRLVREIREHFADALVEQWEPLEGSFGLPDPGDEHVLAAAVAGGAGAVVTLNRKHFPADLVPNNIEVLTPADFAYFTAQLDPERASTALREMAQRTGRHGPPRNEHELLDYLESTHGMAEMATVVRAQLPPR